MRSEDFRECNCFYFWQQAVFFKDTVVFCNSLIDVSVGFKTTQGLWIFEPVKISIE
jgi:hypothetical protein